MDAPIVSFSDREVVLRLGQTLQNAGIPAPVYLSRVGDIMAIRNIYELGQKKNKTFSFFGAWWQYVVGSRPFLSRGKEEGCVRNSVS